MTATQFDDCIRVVFKIQSRSEKGKNAILKLINLIKLFLNFT